MLIILRLTVLPHKHPHELLDSVVKERWLSLSSQPRRAFYSSPLFRQTIFLNYFLKNFFYSTTCITYLFSSDFLIAQKLNACTNSKTPDRFHDRGFWYRCLTMTYSHMGKPHTTIGDASFHY